MMMRAERTREEEEDRKERPRKLRRKEQRRRTERTTTTEGARTEVSDDGSSKTATIEHGMADRLLRRAAPCVQRAGIASLSTRR